MKCILCNQDEELRIGVCYDCATAQEIIGENILKESKPKITNKIIKGLADRGYLIVDKSFVLRALKMGVERDGVGDGNETCKSIPVPDVEDAK